MKSSISAGALHAINPCSERGQAMRITYWGRRPPDLIPPKALLPQVSHAAAFLALAGISAVGNKGKDEQQCIQ